VNALASTWPGSAAGDFSIDLTSSPDPTRIIEDFASIPDLAAGAVAGYFEDPPPKDIQAKTYQLIDLIASRNVPLKRWTFLLAPNANAGS
jgi:hypothetical protein